VRISTRQTDEEWSIHDIVTVQKAVGDGRVRPLSCKKSIDGLDIVDHGHKATREYEQAGDNGENADEVQADEYIWRASLGHSKRNDENGVTYTREEESLCDSCEAVQSVRATCDGRKVVESRMRGEGRTPVRGRRDQHQVDAHGARKERPMRDSGMKRGTTQSPRRRKTPSSTQWAERGGPARTASDAR
jgi:hypothetical protein